MYLYMKEGIHTHTHICIQTRSTGYTHTHTHSHTPTRTALRLSCLFLFVFLFVGIKLEKLYSASCVGREVNLLCVITHGQRHKPRACKRQRYKPRTCQPMVNPLQVDGLVRISGLTTRTTLSFSLPFFGSNGWLDGEPMIPARIKKGERQKTKKRRFDSLRRNVPQTKDIVHTHNDTIYT